MQTTLPNLITLLRLTLVPVIAVLLHRGEHGAAFGCFVVSALSDFADGQIARRWHLESRFGAVADPLADKLTMFTVTVLLAMQQALPWWFASVLVARDIVIVTGALAYRLVAQAGWKLPRRGSPSSTPHCSSCCCSACSRCWRGISRAASGWTC